MTVKENTLHTNKTRIRDNSTPRLRLLDFYGGQATFLCRCQNVFTADSADLENLMWKPHQAMLKVVCPSCGE